MHFSRYKNIWCWFPVLLIGCLEPYNPPAIENYPDLLVVDGFINSTMGGAEVKLSRTTSLTDQSFQPEVKAAITIEDEQGKKNILSEAEAGVYVLAGVTINPSLKYRLIIKTVGNKTYESDFIPVKQSPLIDSVNWIINQDGLNLYVNTHDPSGASRYYLWEYLETYEYTANYVPAFKMQNGQAIFVVDETLYRCWKTTPSTQILIGSSNRLIADRVSNFNLLTIPHASSKLGIKYSILVRQYTLTDGAYNYWLNLQKNTEGLGGLFDPLPSQAIGNIRCSSDPKEFVIGYVSAGSVSEKRIFIDPAQLPKDYSIYIKPKCELDTILIKDIPNLSNGTPLISTIYPPLGPPVLIGYTHAPTSCVDCRTAGGVTTKPDFWD